jgi:anti-sigma B factor antagonist
MRAFWEFAMRMKYAVRTIGDVVVLDLSGPISPGNTIEDRLVLHDLINQQVNAGQKNVLLNLRDVSYIDSSGVGDLIGALRIVQSQGGQLRMCNASQRIGDLLYRTHLDSIISNDRSEESALQAFSGSQKTPAA